MKKLVIILLLTFSYHLAFANDRNDRRDGNWWLYLQSNQKVNYVTGFFDGMELGYNFSYWGVLSPSKDLKDKKAPSCNSMIAESYNSYLAKYFSNVTNIQISDGLDTFYSDYKNRKIKINYAMWLVVQEISGTPKSEMDRIIENWRKNAD